eukprot:c23884_g1_i1 orf=132-2228(-)
MSSHHGHDHHEPLQSEDIKTTRHKRPRTSAGVANPGADDVDESAAASAPMVLRSKTSLGTEPVDPQDNKSHAVIYRYSIGDEKDDHVDLDKAVARESVLDFFYPHSKSGGTKRSKESLDWLKQRRDVFLLAFQNVLALDASDKWSFYQIAGIHGLPHAPYDGDEGDWDPSNPDWWGGYCQHGSPLFPTWHRPYMMLIEQSIIRQAKLLANTVSQSDEKQAVLAIADQLRIPYWDWASHSTRILGLPDVFTSTEISLSYAWKSFSTTTIPNPLKSFVLPANLGKPISSSDVFNPTAKPNYVVPSGDAIPFTPQSYPTVRHVDASYMSQNDQLNLALMRNASSVLVEGVYAMFQHSQWLPFSNHYWSEATHGDGSQFGHYSSLELVHDLVHGIVGGLGGHMTYPELAAFDPIFFFHHANVDRLVALWQYCYPHAWIPDKSLQLDSEGTYTSKPDSEALASTNLTPFRYSNDGQKFITSNDVRLVDGDCGYSYPELIQARKESWSSAKMLAYVMDLYKPPEYFVNRWVLVVEKIQKRAFNGPFSIRVFLDAPDASASTPTSSPNFAGEISVFARSNGGLRCANCERRECMRASLDLTKAMLRLGITTAEELNDAAAAPAADNGSGEISIPNPLSEEGDITLVFVDLHGRQLKPSNVDNWEGVKLSLYFQQGIPNEIVSGGIVQSMDVTARNHKFALTTTTT